MAEDMQVENRQECEEQIDSVDNGGNNADSTEEGENDFAAQVARERERYQPTKLESFFAITKTLIIRGLIIYFITSFFRRPQTADPGPGGTVPTRVPAVNIFENGTVMDLYVYLSSSETFTDFMVRSSDGTRTHNIEFETTEAVRNNGTLFIHVYVTRKGKSPDPAAGKGIYAPHQMAYNRKMLNKYKRLRYKKTQSSYWGDCCNARRSQNQELNWVQGSVPPPLDEYIDFLPGGDRYKPVIYFNEYWNMLRDYQPINKTTKVLQLSLTYQPLSLFKWQIYSAQAMRNKWIGNVMGDTFVDEEDEDQDSLKEALLETSPYLLAITILVSILHSVFELLAFKNDIQFWNNRKSLEGLSVRSVFFNVFQSLIVLLYVLDNDTNTVVKISCFVGLCIEVWKIQKVMDININPSQIKDLYIESSTKEYDTLAFRYLSWVLYPLLGGYAVYSLLYQEHRGWYSFVLNMLYGFLLTFGFIMMTPQLFINYKLKSVAHLPWRMMSYKFLNTFIDDIFAFVIKMPTLYRLGCFRDDQILFSSYFLYQRWIYKTDPTRVNEFGFSAEMEEEAAAARTAQQQANGEFQSSFDKQKELT
ncbi:hypothetical protein L9F63_025383, partial [Diploptera punctata]